MKKIILFITSTIYLFFLNIISIYARNGPLIYFSKDGFIDEIGNKLSNII